MAHRSGPRMEKEFLPRELILCKLQKFLRRPKTREESEGVVVPSCFCSMSVPPYLAPWPSGDREAIANPPQGPTEILEL